MSTYDDLSSVCLLEFIAANNWQSQYRLITQWGKLIQPKPELRKPEYLVKGCEVSAWLSHRVERGTHHFIFDSDSRVINGLVVLLLAQVQGKTTLEVCEVDLEAFLLSVRLEKHLTPSRNNGLKTIILRVKQYVGAA